MAAIADSSAFLDKDRLLTQHQAALTVMQGLLDNPGLKSFSWLDLACGRGQIIAQLDEILSDSARAKIGYFGYDIQSEYTSITEKKAESLGFNSVRMEIGEMSNFHKIYDDGMKFDFITLTNTVHEINARNLPYLYIESILRLGENGRLFIYDMEKLPELELGAITWTGPEMYEIMNVLLKSLGVKEDYSPKPGRWTHKTCYGWNIQLQREYFGVSDKELIDRRQSAYDETTKKVYEILGRKFSACIQSLNSLTKYRANSQEEQAEKIGILYDYWALSIALEVVSR